MLWGIYSAIYGEVNVSVEKCVEIKGDYVEKIAKLFYFCHLKKFNIFNVLQTSNLIFQLF